MSPRGVCTLPWQSMIMAATLTLQLAMAQDSEGESMATDSLRAEAGYVQLHWAAILGIVLGVATVSFLGGLFVPRRHCFERLRSKFNCPVSSTNRSNCNSASSVSGVCDAEAGRKKSEAPPLPVAPDNGSDPITRPVQSESIDNEYEEVSLQAFPTGPDTLVAGKHRASNHSDGDSTFYDVVEETSRHLGDGRRYTSCPVQNEAVAFRVKRSLTAPPETSRGDHGNARHSDPDLEKYENALYELDSDTDDDGGEGRGTVAEVRRGSSRRDAAGGPEEEDSDGEVMLDMVENALYDSDSGDEQVEENARPKTARAARRASAEAKTSNSSTASSQLNLLENALYGEDDEEVMEEVSAAKSRDEKVDKSDKSDISAHDKLISRDSSAHDKLISRDSSAHETLISRDSSAHDKLISRDSSAHDKLISRDSSAYDKLIIRDSSAHDQLTSQSDPFDLDDISTSKSNIVSGIKEREPSQGSAPRLGRGPGSEEAGRKDTMLQRPSIQVMLKGDADVRCGIQPVTTGGIETTKCVCPDVVGDGRSGAKATPDGSSKQEGEMVASSSGQSGRPIDQPDGGRIGAPPDGETTEPNGGQIVTPSGGQTVAPPDGETIGSHGGEIVPPNGGQIVLPNGGQIVPPNGRQIVAPNSGQIVPPNGGQIVAPNGGQIVAPNGGQIVPPHGGQIMAPNGGQIVLPNGGQIVPPNGGQIVAPNGGQIVPPNGGQIVAPNGGQIVAPNGGQIVAPNGGQIVAPNGGQIVTHPCGQTVAPPDGETVALNGGQTAAPTGGQTISPNEEKSDEPFYCIYDLSGGMDD